MTRPIELLPCPVCGLRPAVIPYIRRNGMRFQLDCKNRNAHNKVDPLFAEMQADNSKYHILRSDAEKAWNAACRRYIKKKKEEG